MKEIFLLKDSRSRVIGFAKLKFQLDRGYKLRAVFETVSW
jgi:hypothetical protein